MPIQSSSQLKPQPPKGRKFRTEHLCFGVILLAGLGLRLWHIDWGLPEILEEATPLLKAWKLWNFGGSGLELNPHSFTYPALTYYLLFVVQALQYFIGHILGFYSDLQEIVKIVGPSVIVARCVMVIFDAGTIIVIYLMARRLADSRAALIASALVAVNPLLIQRAHLINVDTPLTFFATVSIFFLIRVHGEPSRRHYLLAGLAIGLAAASKYTGAYLLVALLVTHLLRYESLATAGRSITRSPIILALISAAGVFFCTNPYIILSPGEFLNDISQAQFHMLSGHLGLNPSQSAFGFYLLEVLPGNLTWAFFVVTVVTGTAWLVMKRRQHIILLAYPVTTLLIIGLWAMRADRYILSIIPILILTGSIGLVDGWDRLHRRFIATAAARGSALVIAAAPFAIATVMAIPLMLDVATYHLGLSRPDTRAIAKVWMTANIPPGSAYATGPFGIEFPPATYTAVDIPFSATRSEALAPFYDTRWYEDLDLLIASDYDYGRFVQEPERFHEILQFYDTLRLRWTLLYEVKPAVGQNGPTIWFYAPPHSAKESFDHDLFQHLGILAETTLVANFTENLASALFKKRRLVKSEQLMRTAALLDPDNTRLLKELAYTLFRRNVLEGALNVVTHSLEVNAIQPEVVGLEGSIFLRLNRRAEAESVLHHAIAMNNQLEFPYEELESLYAMTGEHRKLVEVLSRHRTIVPDGSTTGQRIDDQLRALDRHDRR